ncbi:isoaspartyl peptidase/L-asparaginase [Halomonas campisalis]|uniref:Isoaspartyl peptidase/L-asparaginase n=1 Tax=Billgrantia campisalis TaxID=74661 RepID=A0ABS9PDQ1_9GAMM|nr:isoaspartyl peptidase/L-asparaginase [Halomonas campisalis]MCG6659786.1 isoaspartyl peptidase/L-asparaginase [Halomonas campisalis]MDR5864940.1 isoaspartyl peptidase/L-asparaginase [Halomonas campisalis]
MTGFVLAIHGGAGTLRRGAMTLAQERHYRSALEQALLAGHAIMKQGGRSLDAAVAATVVLEDSPLFNAGRGSVYNHDGRHEMDAAVMDGQGSRAGAIAGISSARNPVLAARCVMEHTEHVLLCGAGAEAFVRDQGLDIEDAAYFHTPLRWEQLLSVRDSPEVILDHSETASSNKDDKLGTVGAVARDADGNLAAATSTGGLTNKRYGRVGDSPIIGHGTYADTRVAVSATGVGEAFMKAMAGHDVAARMKYAGVSLANAAHAVIHESVHRLGGYGGLIAVDRDGNVTLPFNTEGMYRGVIREAGSPHVEIHHSVPDE